MSISAILLFIMVVVFFIVGLLGIFLPVIPSLPVVWCGIFFYGVLTNFSEVTITVVVITGALMIIGTVCDLFVGSFGAKKYGASWAGICGSFFGGMIGAIIFNIGGFIIGTFVGAFVGEFIFYKKTHAALKAGAGTIVGFLFGIAIKIFIAFVMFGIFIFALF
ncbi:MAG: DUF456 domain-containing protein [Parcubacteria group bacterium]|jgi:hypothetical protein